MSIDLIVPTIAGREASLERCLASFEDTADLSGLDDAAVVHNCMSYPADTALPDKVFRYHHDVARAPLDTHALDAQPRHIFCSPIQRERMGFEKFEGTASHPPSNCF